MGSGGAIPLGGGVCRDNHEPDRRYGPDVVDVSGLALQGVRCKMSEQVPGPREDAGENQAHNYGAGVPNI
jgi:hypothetical protein